MHPEQATLVVWPGRGALPSLDPACLVAIALASLASGINAFIRITRMQVGGVSLLTGSRCPPFLQADISEQEPKNGMYDMTKAINITLSADTAALVAFMHAELRPLIEYIAFAQPNNWYSVFRKVYAQGSHFPLNVILPETIRRTAIQDLKAAQFRIPVDGELLNGDDTETPLTTSGHTFSERVQAVRTRHRDHQARLRSSFSDQAFLKRAASVLNVLNAALPEQRHSYYYGVTQATAADAVSCAYLSILLFDGLPEKSTARYLENQYSRIVEHTKRMSKMLFDRFSDAHPVVSKSE